MPIIENRTMSTRPIEGEEISLKSDFQGVEFTAIMPRITGDSVDFVDPSGPSIAEEESTDGQMKAIVIRIQFES